MYNKTNWVDGETTLSAERFNNIESGIENNEAKTVIPNPTIKTGDDVVKNLLKWNNDQSYYEKDENGMPFDGSDIIQLGKFYSVGAFDSGDVGYRLYRQSDGTMTTDVRSPEYYIGCIHDVNTAYIGVQGGEDKGQSVSVSNLVAEVVLDAEASSIVIDDLDIDTDGGMYEFWLSGTSNSARTISMYINTDVTETNYYAQYLKAVDSSISGARTNSPAVGVMYSDQSTIIGRVIRNPVSSHVVCDTDCIYRGGLSLEARRYKLVSVSTFTNITKLTFTNSSNFNIGTTLKIFKR